MSKTSKYAKIQEIALLLGVNPSWLDSLINFETAGTYSPMVKNPTSSARGLIQVIDATARSDFGVPDSLSLVNMYPDFNSQMDNVVYPYLKKYMPFANKKELYMAVFYPKYRKKPSNTVFPNYVQKANPGIKTIQDYINYVDKNQKNKKDFSPPFQLAPTLLLVGAGAFGLWYLLRGR